MTKISPVGVFWEEGPEHQNYSQRFPNVFKPPFPRRDDSSEDPPRLPSRSTAVWPSLFDSRTRRISLIWRLRLPPLPLRNSRCLLIEGQPDEGSFGTLRNLNLEVVLSVEGEGLGVAGEVHRITILQS